MTTTNTTLAVDVLLNTDALQATVTDRRADVVGTLVPLNRVSA
jgi:hypothetical protein